MTFDLNALIRKVADESSAADPAIVAKEVLSAIKRADRDAALAQALVIVVRNLVARARHLDLPVGQTCLDAQGPPADRGSTDTPAGHRAGDAHAESAGGSSSWKVQGIREAWRRALKDRIACGDGTWKFLADCESEDLRRAATVRDAHAARVLAHAERYRRLDALLTEHDVRTVGELPESLLAVELEAAA